jgi:hypothetical protein
MARYTAAARRYNNLHNEGGYGFSPSSADDFYTRADAARVARYGRTTCACCGQVYAVNYKGDTALDHQCPERTAAARGED